MTDFDKMRISRAAQALPLVYVIRRSPDRTVSAVLIAGSLAPWAEVALPFPR